jgi:hypothetical protein
MLPWFEAGESYYCWPVAGGFFRLHARLLGKCVYDATNTHSKVFLGCIGTALVLAVSAGLATAQAHRPPKAPKSLRLYIFDCGVIHTTNGDAYSLNKEEMASTEMSIPCILVAHPKGDIIANARLKKAPAFYE